MDQATLQLSDRLISVCDTNGFRFTAARVTAAEYNGNNFADAPFAYTDFAASHLLNRLLREGHMRFYCLPTTAHEVLDHGVWELQVQDHQWIKLFPGNVILFRDGKIIPVVGEAVGTFLIISTGQKASDVAQDEIQCPRRRGQFAQ